MNKTAYIFVNPNSKGNSVSQSNTLKKQLEKENFTVYIKNTHYKGHINNLVLEHFSKNSEALYISASGDGGYHEMINALINASKKLNKKPFCAVLPSGNANDHGSAVYSKPLYQLIIENSIIHMDILSIKLANQEIYAHSYASLGFTARAGHELNKNNFFKFFELFAIIKTAILHRPVKLIYGKMVKKLDSIIFFNTNRMAKVLTTEKNDLTDGLFEVIEANHVGTLHLIIHFLIGAVKTFNDTKTVHSYEFITVKKTMIQCDGEVRRIAKNTKVVITSLKQAIKTFS